MIVLDPALHCFREDSPTDECRDCGQWPEVHTGCDCEEESLVAPSVIGSTPWLEARGFVRVPTGWLYGSTILSTEEAIREAVLS